MEVVLFLVEKISLFLMGFHTWRAELSERVCYRKEYSPSFSSCLFPSAPLAPIMFARSVDRRSRICSPGLLSREGLLAVYHISVSTKSEMEIIQTDQKPNHLAIFKCAGVVELGSSADETALASDEAASCSDKMPSRL